MRKGFLLALLTLTAGCMNEGDSQPPLAPRFHVEPGIGEGCQDPGVVLGCNLTSSGPRLLGIGFLTGQVGTEVSVPIKVSSGGEPIVAWGIDLRYPRDMLEYVSIRRADVDWSGIGGRDWPQPQYDFVRMGGYIGVGGVPAGTQARIAFVTFRVLRSGTGQFEWVKLWDNLEGFQTNCPFTE